MLSPVAQSSTDDACVVPGRAEITGAETPTGRCGTTSDQVKYGVSAVSPPTRSSVVEGPVPTPIRTGEGYWPSMIWRCSQHPGAPSAVHPSFGPP